MWYKKKGFPEEEELVLCTVTKILPHSVFVTIDEYDNMEGLIHISEVTPGRVKNIRDFVKENKKLVCKVLKVNRENNHIDLSLRRVNLGQRKDKLEELQFEEKAEKILEGLGKKLKIPIEEMYKKIGTPLVQKYGSLSKAFQELVDQRTEWKELQVPDSLKADLISTVREKIKPPEVSVIGTVTLSSMKSNGVEIIKSVLVGAEEVAKKKNFRLEIMYVGAPKYRLVLYSRDFKSAEKCMDDIGEFILKEMKKHGGIAEIVR